MYLKFLILFTSLLLKYTFPHKIYYINDRMVDWNTSYNECKNIGMNLVSIKTEEEWSYLKEYLKEYRDPIPAYWLGGYKINGTFVWIANGEKIKKFFWHEGEPNNKNGHEYCIHSWEVFFDWNDNVCTRVLPSICDLEV